MKELRLSSFLSLSLSLQNKKKKLFSKQKTFLWDLFLIKNHTHILSSLLFLSLSLFYKLSLFLFHFSNLSRNRGRFPVLDSEKRQRKKGRGREGERKNTVSLKHSKDFAWFLNSWKYSWFIQESLSHTKVGRRRGRRF